MCADKGNYNVMFQYTQMLSEGKGVPKNEEEAFRYFIMSADKGIVGGIMACY